MRKSGKLVTTAIAVLFMAVFGMGLTGCGGGDGAADSASLESFIPIPKPGVEPLDYIPHPPAEAAVYNLCAGKWYDTGNLFVWVEWDEALGEYVMFVQYDMVYPGTMKSTRLAVVEDPADFPTTNSGSPKIGHFPYGDEHEPMEVVTYMVPLGADDPAGMTYYIAAHAVAWVNDTCFWETAWAACCCNPDCDPFGIPFSEDSGWATYFAYTVDGASVQPL